MKTASTALKAHLSQGQTTLAYLWKIKRQDGLVFGFTNHDVDILYDSGDGDGVVTYNASTGFANTAAQNKSDLSVDNLEAVGFLDSSYITESDLRAGLYDDADIKLLLVNYADLTMGHMWVRRGTLGVVKLENGKFTAELRGLTYKMSTDLGDTLGPICRAQFGSGLNGIDVNSKWLCKIDVTAYRVSTSVYIVNSPINFSAVPNLLMVGSPTPTALAPPGWFADGLVHFTGGANVGLTFEIKDYNSLGEIILYLPPPYPLAYGDPFWIEPGCDKTADTCQNKYNNIVNFRGEPFIPGMDRFLDMPGAGSGKG